MNRIILSLIAVLLLLSGGAYAADTSYNTLVYHEQGGDREVVASGGTIAVESGGILNIESGGLLKIAGTQITPTATQFNFLSGVTAGTSASNKAVVLGATGKIDTIDLTAWKIGGTSVTATAANLNAIPTATGTGAEIDEMTKNVMSSASTMVLAGAGTTVETVTITLKDADGSAIAAGQRIKVYISDDAAGLTPATSGANGAVSFTTGGTLKEVTTKLQWEVITDANGVAVLSINNAGGGGAYAKYVVLVLPNGKLKVSAVLNVTQA